MKTKRSFRLSNLPGVQSSYFSTVNAEDDRSLSNHLLRRTIWQKVKFWAFPHLKQSEKLVKEHFEARIKKEQNEASKIEVQTNILKIKEVREFNSLIDEIFSNNDLPEVAKALKIAKVIENNPEVLELLKIVQNININFQVKDKSNAKPIEGL